MPLPYELRIGVTGHRSVSDCSGVAAAIDALLDRIKGTLAAPGTPLACVLVSPLAAGADRIVARAAMERLGARLEVVTPFPVDQYRMDFETAADRAEFDALLAQAAVVDELPGTTTGGAPASISHAARRDAAYHRVGERVVDACEMLIAVWNGRRAAGTGGTADIIEHALRRERLVIWINTEHPETPPRLVRHIAYADHGDEALVETTELPTQAKELSLGFHQQSAYFCDCALDERRVEATAAEVRQRFTRAAAKAGVPEGALTGVVESIVPEFARADCLALRYQWRHVLVVNGVLRIAASAVTVATFQVLFFPEHLWLIALEIVAMLAVLGLWWGGRHGAWHEKWLHDRFLAEQLRAAMFTVVAGAHRGAPDDRTLAFYRGPRHWLTHVGDALAAQAQRGISPVPLGPLRRLLVDGWMKDQQAFHERNARRKARQAHSRHRMGFALFGGTLLMALLHLLGVGHAAEGVPPVADPSAWITFFALVFPVWAGVVHAITAQLELERVAERSTRMAATLAGLADRAERALTPLELDETAREAASLMLRETHEWWVLLSFQDVRLQV
ncbi:MAG: hypothetical protein A3H29_11755 [Acidobacteria bacterium RIFCSPLOWO2_02_FULL_67_21]|nr:MAG: hypothetical protein A3H29_11755 [Acidobacteria bacterium RIFCSPLOWO2_02_FULL_67_21]